MESLAASVPGVANAFFVLLLVMAIFAILGVQVGADLTLLTQGYSEYPRQTSRPSAARLIPLGVVPAFVHPLRCPVSTRPEWRPSPLSARRRSRRVPRQGASSSAARRLHHQMCAGLRATWARRILAVVVSVA